MSDLREAMHKRLTQELDIEDALDEILDAVIEALPPHTRTHYDQSYNKAISEVRAILTAAKSNPNKEGDSYE